MNSHVREFLLKLLLIPQTEMISAQFLWESVVQFLEPGELRKYAQNSNFENFESALNMTSVSMPLINVFVSLYFRMKLSEKDA